MQQATAGSSLQGIVRLLTPLLIGINNNSSEESQSTWKERNPELKAGQSGTWLSGARLCGGGVGYGLEASGFDFEFADFVFLDFAA